MVYFDKCAVLINNSGILAESARISSNNAISPIYSLGRKGISNQAPEGNVENKINITFFLDLSKPIITDLVASLKNLTGSYAGLPVKIGGISILNCYLTDFSFDSEANQLIKGTANFINYKTINGTFSEGDNSVIPSGFEGNLAHGAAVRFTSGYNVNISPIYSFGYTFNANWEPTFILGNEQPIQVDLTNISEKMTFIKENFKKIEFSGESALRNSSAALISGVDPNINFYGYLFIGDNNQISPSYSINLSGARIQASESQVGLDSFIQNETTVLKYY